MHSIGSTSLPSTADNAADLPAVRGGGSRGDAPCFSTLLRESPRPAGQDPGAKQAATAPAEPAAGAEGQALPDDDPETAEAPADKAVETAAKPLKSAPADDAADDDDASTAEQPSAPSGTDQLRMPLGGIDNALALTATAPVVAPPEPGGENLPNPATMDGERALAPAAATVTPPGSASPRQPMAIPASPAGLENVATLPPVPPAEVADRLPESDTDALTRTAPAMVDGMAPPAGNGLLPAWMKFALTPPESVPSAVSTAGESVAALPLTPMPVLSLSTSPGPGGENAVALPLTPMPMLSLSTSPGPGGKNVMGVSAVTTGEFLSPVGNGLPSLTIAAAALAPPFEVVALATAALKASQALLHSDGPESLTIGAAHGEATPLSMAATPPRTELPLPSLQPVSPVPLDMQRSGWGHTLGQQLVWMVENQVQHADIKLNPPHLGPLEVRLSLQQDQANVTFFSHDSAVRHAIESSLPRLREMLDGQGVRLAQAQVSDQSLARQQQDSGGQTNGRHRGYGPVDDGITIGSETDSPRVTRTALGMVDHYV